MDKPALYATCAAFCGATAVMVWQVGGGTHEPDPTLRAKLGAVERRVAGLQTELKLEQSRNRLLAARASDADVVNGLDDSTSFDEHGVMGTTQPTPMSPLTAAPASDEELVAQSARLAQARQDAIEEVLAAEARDAGWARETEANLRSWYSGLDPERFAGTVLEGVECRSTLCKLTLHQEHKAQQLEVAGTIRIETLPRVFARFEDRNGHHLTSLYLVRSGFQLPGPSRYDQISGAEVPIQSVGP